MHGIVARRCSRCCCARGGRRPDAGPARRGARATARSGSASPRAPGSAATAATTSPSSDDDEDGEWESDCAPGPVRVSLRVRGGRVADAHAYVGGRWRPPEGQTTDLGTGAGPAGGGRPARAGRAAPGGTPRSWSPRPRWPTARSCGRPCSGSRGAAELPLETRRQAVFWLGQAAGEAATRGLDSLASDDERRARGAETGGVRAVAAAGRRRRAGADPDRAHEPARRAPEDGALLAGPERGSAGDRVVRGDPAVAHRAAMSRCPPSITFPRMPAHPHALLGAALAASPAAARSGRRRRS